MQRVHQLMEKAVTDRLFPAATLLVAADGQPLLHRAYGRGRLDTVYDLASLTKPLATTTVLMQLVAAGKLRLRDRLDRWLPSLSGRAIGRARIWHLLSHSAGLPAWLPLFEQAAQRTPSARRRSVRALAAAASGQLLAPPGRATVYSDLGFILLDWIIERCTKSRLDRLAARLVFTPLNLTRTRFIDLARAEQRARLLDEWPFAPTERCPVRKRRLVAEVHDENCWAMGGISGHAGLFSTAHDVHLIAAALVAAHRGSRALFSPAAVRRFLDFRSPSPPGARALGWDRPARGGAAGRHFSEQTVGHLGFTGTSLWIDLERALWVILLTNRVYRGRTPNPMVRFRPQLHDEIVGRALPRVLGARRVQAASGRLRGSAPGSAPPPRHRRRRGARKI